METSCGRDRINLLKSILIITALLSQTATWANDRQQREVRIGISFSIPPYVIRETNDGLELALLRESFAVKGYRVRPSYLPLARTFINFEKGSLDGIINVKEGMVEGYDSDVVITFQNRAVSLASNQFSINNIKDLSNKSITAFQRASDLLDSKFGAWARANPLYNEIADQSLQIKQLFKSRVDVIILEEKIFKYYRKQLYNNSLALDSRSIVSTAELKQPVIYHDIFVPTEYRFAFTSKIIRDDFNQGLEQIKNNGVYEDIMHRFDGKFELP